MLDAQQQVKWSYLWRFFIFPLSHIGLGFPVFPPDLRAEIREPEVCVYVYGFVESAFSVYFCFLLLHNWTFCTSAFLVFRSYCIRALVNVSVVFYLCSFSLMLLLFSVAVISGFSSYFTLAVAVLSFTSSPVSFSWLSTPVSRSPQLSPLPWPWLSLLPFTLSCSDCLNSHCVLCLLWIQFYIFLLDSARIKGRSFVM